MGRLDILNPGYGHLEITFSPEDEEGKETARKAITDMIKRNYLIVVKDNEGVEHKVTDFDPEMDCYIVKEVGGEITIPAQTSEATAVAPAAGG
jgi:hypothetical protein